MNQTRRELLPTKSKSYFKTSGLNKTNAFHKKLPLTKIYKFYLSMDPHHDARRQVFRLFSQLSRFSLSSTNFLFQIVLPFELQFISINFFFTYSRQIGEYLTRDDGRGG